MNNNNNSIESGKFKIELENESIIRPTYTISYNAKQKGSKTHYLLTMYEKDLLTLHSVISEAIAQWVLTKKSE